MSKGLVALACNLSYSRPRQEGGKISKLQASLGNFAKSSLQGERDFFFFKLNEGEPRGKARA